VHVAIIMDGNGRWAKQRGLPRSKGHEAGANAVEAALKFARDHGIRYLTLYAFSVENWKRPAEEVGALMRLLRKFLTERERELHETRTRLRVQGRVEDLPLPVRTLLRAIERRTEGYTDRTLVLCLSYGARTEIVHAAAKVAEDVKSGRLAVSDIDEKTFARAMYLPDVPDPDLIIRTSGEERLSNFLLWQAAYSEFYFTPVLWPDFGAADFEAALAAFHARKRRFGGV